MISTLVAARRSGAGKVFRFTKGALARERLLRKMRRKLRCRAQRKFPAFLDFEQQQHSWMRKAKTGTASRAPPFVLAYVFDKFVCRQAGIVWLTRTASSVLRKSSVIASPRKLRMRSITWWRAFRSVVARISALANASSNSILCGLERNRR